MLQASYLEGGPLMWMLPLYLHVNQNPIMMIHDGLFWHYTQLGYLFIFDSLIWKSRFNAFENFMSKKFYFMIFWLVSLKCKFYARIAFALIPFSELYKNYIKNKVWQFIWNIKPYFFRKFLVSSTAVKIGALRVNTMCKAVWCSIKQVFMSLDRASIIHN